MTTLLLLVVGSLIGEKRVGGDTLFLAVALIVLTLIIRIGYTKIFLRIHDGEKPKFSDIFNEYNTFWRYLGVSILTPLAIFGGLILLIIPGVILAVRLSLAPIAVVDTKSGPIISMKESYAITKDKFWQLLLFWIVIGFLNIVGLLAAVIGLLVTIPVSTLATIYVYRILTESKAAVLKEVAPMLQPFPHNKT